jgi:hypothetical protein
MYIKRMGNEVRRWVELRRNPVIVLKSMLRRKAEANPLGRLNTLCRI